MNNFYLRHVKCRKLQELERYHELDLNVFPGQVDRNDNFVISDFGSLGFLTHSIYGKHIVKRLYWCDEVLPYCQKHIHGNENLTFKSTPLNVHLNITYQFVPTNIQMTTAN